MGRKARSRLPGALRWSQEGNCCFPGVGVTGTGRGADRGLVSARRCHRCPVEKGDLMVVELCQSHVRTLFVTLLGDGNQSPQLMYKTFELPADKLQGTGEAVRGGGGSWYRRAPTTSCTPGCWGRGAAAHPLPSQLFDFVAQCVQKFLEEIGNPQHRLPVGFVFPFSCRQTGLGKVSGAARRGGGQRHPQADGQQLTPRALCRPSSSPGPRASSAAMWRARTWCSCCRQPSTSWRWCGGGCGVPGKGPVQAGGCPPGDGADRALLPASSTTWKSSPCSTTPWAP